MLTEWKRFSGAFAIPLVTGMGGFPLRWTVGASISPTNFLVGDLGQYYVSIGTDIDPTQASVKNGFTDPATGLPTRLLPDGSDAIAGVRPIIFLDGGAQVFPLNLTAASWNNVATPDPSAVWYDGSYTDQGPNEFTVAHEGGELDALAAKSRDRDRCRLGDRQGHRRSVRA